MAYMECLGYTTHGTRRYAAPEVDPPGTTPGLFSAVRTGSPRRVVSVMYGIRHSSGSSCTPLRVPGTCAALVWHRGTPMSYEQLEYTSSFASEQCPEGDPVALRDGVAPGRGFQDTPAEASSFGLGFSSQVV